LTPAGLKNGISHYGFKNSVCIDVDHDSSRRYAVTPANIHDSQMPPRLLDPDNEHDYVFGQTQRVQVTALRNFSASVNSKA
jgi:hypothetical protein